MYYDIAKLGGGYYGRKYDSWPDPMPGWNFVNAELSIYATYTLLSKGESEVAPLPSPLSCNPDRTGTDGLCHEECGASRSCVGAAGEANPCCSGCYCVDINGNGIVDIRDIATVARAFGSGPGDENYLIADINGGGEIDIRDIAMVAKKFGTGCS